VTILALEKITKVLMDCGLTNNQTKIYIYLAKTGPCKASEISNALNIHRTEVYNLLMDLQGKGIVEATLERPARFTVVPFDKALNLLIESKRREAELLGESKSELLAAWETLQIKTSSAEVEKFQVIEGRGQLYSKIAEMLESSKSEIKIITTTLSYVYMDLVDLVTRIRKISSSKGVKTQILTELTNLNVTPLRSSKAIEVKHVHFTTKFFPRFIIIDDREALVFITSEVTRQQDSGLWTNNNVLIQLLKSFFEVLWKSGVECKVILPSR
jgi:sugar-specific transcriptional regulator TrmB